MTFEVVVTKKGQVTIPAELRKKFKIEKGTRLTVMETEEGILFKPKNSCQIRKVQEKIDNPPDFGTIKGKLSREEVYEDTT